jgi:hypothetical protein
MGSPSGLIAQSNAVNRRRAMNFCFPQQNMMPNPHCEKPEETNPANYIEKSILRITGQLSTFHFVNDP